MTKEGVAGAQQDEAMLEGVVNPGKPSSLVSPSHPSLESLLFELEFCWMSLHSMFQDAEATKLS